MITHAYYGREGIIVTDDGRRFLFTAKRHWLPKGYAVPQDGEPHLFTVPARPATFLTKLEGVDFRVTLSPPWVDYHTAPVVIALLRQGVRRFEMDRETVAQWPARLKVPSVAEAIVQLRTGAFNFAPLPL